MTKDSKQPAGRMSRGITRRRVLERTAHLGAAAIFAPAIITHASAARAASLAPYREAKIDWRMANGQSITVGVIPASYFENLISIAQEFEDLTGVTVRHEKIPPGQIRQKVVLDLSTKTGIYATHAADPMYYPLYVANGWVDPLDDYLKDSRLTDAAWFDYEDINSGWRGATSVKGRPYGIPYDGEATVQVYRKDVYDAKGLKPAETLDEYAANAKAVHDPANRLWGCALRGFAGAGQNMYIFPSLFLAYGGKWFDASGQMKVNGLRPVGGGELELARHRRRLFPGHGGLLHRRPFVLGGDRQSAKIEGAGQDRLRPLAQGAVGQAGDLDLELELPDQRRAFEKSEDGDLAVYPVGRLQGDPGAHIVQVHRPDQAFRGQPRLDLGLIRLHLHPQGRRA